MYEPKESEEYPGFYEIPAIARCVTSGQKGYDGHKKFSNYVISKTGEIINKRNGKLISTTSPNERYDNTAMTSDCGVHVTHRIHRLLCQAFKSVDGMEFLQVDHIDGFRKNNELYNLEWVTPLENTLRVGKMGLSPKCRPIAVLDVVTNTVEEFESIVACARVVGVSKDYINYRVNSGPDRIFPEMKRYRFGHTNDDWLAVDHKLEKARFGRSNIMIARNVLTGKIKTFAKQHDLAIFCGIKDSTLSVILKQCVHPVLPGYWQVRFLWDKEEWIPVRDPYLAVQGLGASKPINVIDTIDNTLVVYKSALSCCRIMGIKPQALNYRLQNPLDNIYDGRFRFRYRKEGDLAPGPLQTEESSS